MQPGPFWQEYQTGTTFATGAGSSGPASGKSATTVEMNPVNPVHFYGYI